MEVSSLARKSTHLTHHRGAAFSIMQYGGNSLTVIQLPARARVLVFVFPQSVSERPTFSKLKRCIFCWGHWGLGKRPWCFSTCRRDLRRGELAGLKWEDFDFKNLHVSVTRSLVDQHVGPVKTEASRKLMPIDEYVAHDLLAWYEVTHTRSRPIMYGPPMPTALEPSVGNSRSGLVR